VARFRWEEEDAAIDGCLTARIQCTGGVQQRARWFLQRADDAFALINNKYTVARGAIGPCGESEHGGASGREGDVFIGMCSSARRSAASPLATSTPPDAGKVRRESSARIRSNSVGTLNGPSPRCAVSVVAAESARPERFGVRAPLLLIRPVRPSGTQIFPGALHDGSRRESPPECKIRMRVARVPSRPRLASSAIHRSVLPPLPTRLPAGSAITSVARPRGSVPRFFRISSICSA